MKNKLFSIFTALAMVLGILVAPFTSAMAADNTDEKTNTVYVHKILMTKDQLSKHDPKKEGYDGNQIPELEEFFGTGAEEIPGVYFVVEKEFEVPDTSEGAEEGATKKVWKAVTKTGDQAQDDLSDALAGLTERDNTNNFTALKLDTSKLPAGTYRINEIHEKSTYKGEDGETLTDMKAVPTLITLPLVNDKGVVKEAHVYPKNTEEKPDTHKDFTKEFKTEQPNGRTEDAKESAKPENHNVGDVIDYTVTTKVPAKTKWKTAFWDDKMTEGLTYITKTAATGELDGKGISIKYDGQEMNASWYELDETENGFTLKLTQKGLEEIAKATEDKTIRLDYHAVLNEKAVVAIPESNEVTFHYGNNEDHGNTPVPNKPNDNGELTITKDWDTGVAKQNVTFTLYNAQTGKMVTAGDVESVDGYEFENPVTITAGETMTYTWKGLNKNIEYKVVETYLDGHSVEYGKGDAGQLSAKNYKDNNPKPINPNEPKVQTGGAKFVKTNADGTERLKNAKFVVKNSENKFLTGTAADRTAYEAAQQAFLIAVQAYNKAVETKPLGTDNTVEIGGVKYDNDANAKAAIAKLEKVRDELWNATLKNMTKWDGTSKEDRNNITLTSNAEGQFEIAGLAPGKYTLVEIAAPEGYALPSNAEFEFEIKADGTQALEDIDFGVTDENADDNAQKVINKKVTIPETGGIGSLIFVVAGLAIMGFAYASYRKSQYQEA